MSIEHTPGPWHTMAGAPWNVLDDSGSRIAIFHSNDLCGDATPQDEANAKVAAAAPRLLKACEGALWLLTRAEQHMNVPASAAVDNLRTAIARAKGEPAPAKGGVPADFHWKAAEERCNDFAANLIRSKLAGRSESAECLRRG